MSGRLFDQIAIQQQTAYAQYADAAGKLAEPVLINGVPFDGTKDIIIAGGEGGQNASSIGGFPVNMSAVQNGDMIEFNNTSWVNVNKNAITDGGNF